MPTKKTNSTPPDWQETIEGAIGVLNKLVASVEQTLSRQVHELQVAQLDLSFRLQAAESANRANVVRLQEMSERLSRVESWKRSQRGRGGSEE